MNLLRPPYLAWWEILPLAIACWGLRYQYVRSVRRRQLVASRFSSLSRRSTWVREVLVLVLTVVAGGAIVVALARPQALLTRRTPMLEQQDLIVVLDRSASMRAHDVAPSRFARATREIQNFIEHKPEGIGRIGLVGFAGGSLILSHLTNDVETVSFYLDWINHDPQTLLGTDIGAALKNAREVARRDDRRTRKLFLLVSDGEDHGGELARQLQAFRADGYRVNCIGIGSDELVPIPVVDPDGRDNYLRDERGQMVKTKFEEATLRRIATTTGGRYLRSITGGELAKGIDDIVKGERRVQGWRTTTEYQDLYPWALALAAAAGAALFLLL